MWDNYSQCAVRDEWFSFLAQHRAAPDFYPGVGIREPSASMMGKLRSLTRHGFSNMNLIDVTILNKTLNRSRPDEGAEYVQQMVALLRPVVQALDDASLLDRFYVCASQRLVLC